MIIGLLPALAAKPVAAHTYYYTGDCNLYQPPAEEGGYDPFCVFLHPSVTDAYKPGWSHTLDTLRGTQAAPQPTPGQPDTNAQTRQVFDRYLDYAILASASDSIGDFQLDFTIPWIAGVTVNAIEIYVPPDFTWLGPTKEESIWTDITDDYAFIWTSTRSAYDTIAPNWVRVRIGGDWYSANEVTIAPGNYHVRFFNLRAPDVAGLYHMKIYWRGTVGGVYGSRSIGSGNYPIVIVKSELNPAWVEKTVRVHAYTSLAFAGRVSGKVLAEGTTPEGRSVSAVAYWGPWDYLGASAIPGQPGDLYRTYVFGLAEGTYDLTVSASGFKPTTTERFSVFAGQSYHMFDVLFSSPIIGVTVWSKHGTGAIPWHNLWQMPFGTNNPAAAPNDLALGGTGQVAHRDILFDLYDSENNFVGFWGSDDYGWKLFSPRNTIFSTLPTAVRYDNWLQDDRALASIVWDGHVPLNIPDYVSGITNGQYTIEVFVTGYIMEESDAYQRTFTVAGTAQNVQMDLRRTNWIETTMHLPANTFLSSAGTTVTLTAEDDGGNERASVSFLATWAMSLDGDLDGADVSSVGVYAGGIVIEGWTGLFPNFNARGPSRDPNVKDYGLNPTASSHTAETVTLSGNPYTIKLYMADMGVPYAALHNSRSTAIAAGREGTGWYNPVGTPQASVFLCNSPTPLSFSIVNAWIWISLRSVDFEVPAHSRPWTFPGSEIWVEFIDHSTGDTVDTLDPTLYGLIQDPGRSNVFVAGTAGNPVGTGFPIVGTLPADADHRGVSPFDIDNDPTHHPGMHQHVGVYYYGSDFCSVTIGGAWPIPFCMMSGWRSTSLPAGDYDIVAHTHGYIMRRHFAVSLPFANGADIEADLIQGGQIRVVIEFKHEGIATPFNGFIRVEVFNSEDTLVGASIYGMASPNAFTWAGALYTDYNPFIDWQYVRGPSQGADLDHFLTGVYPSSGVFTSGQRAMWSSAFYGAPPATWALWSAMVPSDANRVAVPAGQVQGVDVYGFYWYYGDAARTWAGGWPTVNGWHNEGFTGAKWDSGIKGTADIPGWEGSGGGLYSVKVWAFDPAGPDGVAAAAWPPWGHDSFEAGFPTDDWRMYSMGWELSGIDLPWGGNAQLFITMNNMASLRGTIRWFDMFGNLRALPWAQISASPGPATDSIPAYSSGNGALGAGASDPSGAFIMWLPAGSHDVSVSTSEAPQVWSSSAPTSNAEYTVVVSDGWVGGGDTQLAHEEGVPVPELPVAAPLAMFAAIAAAVWLLRKRTVSIPVLMK
jgi:hypothetical protein